MEIKKFIELNDIDAYKAAFHLSNKIWDLTLKWSYFEKDTIGKQYVRSIDSISANLAEGFGRYHKKDKILFYRYSYGSIYESLDWNEKARIRNLICNEDYNLTLNVLKQLPRQINQLIQYTEQKLKI